MATNKRVTITIGGQADASLGTTLNGLMHGLESIDKQFLKLERTSNRLSKLIGVDLKTALIAAGLAAKGLQVANNFALREGGITLGQASEAGLTGALATAAASKAKAFALNAAKMALRAAPVAGIGYLGYRIFDSARQTNALESQNLDALQELMENNRKLAELMDERLVAETKLLRLDQQTAEEIEKQIQRAFSANPFETQARLTQILSGSAFQGTIPTMEEFKADRARLEAEIDLQRQALEITRTDGAGLGEITATLNRLEAVMQQARGIAPYFQENYMSPADLIRQRIEVRKNDEEIAKLRREIADDAWKETMAIQRQIDTARQAAYLNTVRGQLDPGARGSQMWQLVQQLGDQVQNTAAIVTGTLGTAFATVSDQLTNLIMGTVTWGEALLNVAKNITGALVKAVVNFFVNYLAQQLIAAVFGRGINAATAAASAAAWAGPALLANTATLGAASAIGTASLMSSLAMAPGVAAMGALAGYAEGGFTGAGGRLQLAGLVHRGEFVFPQSAVKRIGLPALESMKDGGMPGAGPVNVAIFDDRSKLREWFETAEGRKTVLDTFGKAIHNFR